ncbi:phage tail protein [Neorhizobium sp. S3-V5DH]|uniref:phage nozzle protein n=1 Tax=Neorhizobium sp. S3-V5DH TaxID=2485166 RepID=UPI00104AE557|nr:phage tail protein [Neorhizobium sp. S3-V5DH]TCV62306.1 hypothetical protein EDE09_12470 [Neorhizobium sp. S3-V5DH]
MARISGAIPNFANGISQQAMALRLATQGDLQVNAYSTIIEGNKKRPPTEHVAALGDTLINGAPLFTHLIQRDTTEQYWVFATRYGIRVFDINGVEKTVNAPNGWGYLNHSASLTTAPFRACTVADYTFIVNQTKATAMDATVTPDFKSDAIFNIQAGNYGRTYEIKIDGVVKARYRTPDGDSAAQSPAVDVSYIAERLLNGKTITLETTVNGQSNGNWTWKATDTNLAANGITPANGWTTSVMGGVIYVRKNDGTTFKATLDDGYNGNASKLIQREVQDFSSLPQRCVNGAAVEITGTPGNDFDNYYVRYDTKDDDSPAGVWKEVPMPGIKTSFNASTMPHVLVREANGTFTFKPPDWNLRKAGDDDTCPVPSFVGKKVNEVFFFKNRIGYLSGESVIMSRAGSYFDFWRATATSLLDDDPIDVAGVGAEVAILHYAEAQFDRLVIFSDRRQYILMGNELLTQKTVSIRPSTAYPSAPQVAPVSSGRSLFFAMDRGLYTMIREYIMDADSAQADADDVTSHVPQYIPGKPTLMAAAPQEDLLAVYSPKDAASLYVYKYYWNGEDKLQSSWSKWSFPGVTKVLNFKFIDSTLLMVLDRGGSVFFEKMDVQPGAVDENGEFVVNLDRRVLVSSKTGRTYDPFDDKTVVPVPFDPSEVEYVCVTAGKTSGSTKNHGIKVQIAEVGVDTVTLYGDMRKENLFFGIDYTMRYRLSTIFIRQQSQSGGTSAITEGRLQLIKLMLQYSKSTFIRVDVTPLGRSTRTYIHNGRLMGDPENKVDVATLRDGTFGVPILAQNNRVDIEIINDSYLPSSVLSAEWTGEYVQRTRRT